MKWTSQNRILGNFCGISLETIHVGPVRQCRSFTGQFEGIYGNTLLRTQ